MRWLNGHLFSFPMTKKQINRHMRALTRLDAQLKSGVKVVPSCKNEGNGEINAALTETDVNRINKERAVLKDRLVRKGVQF